MEENLSYSFSFSVVIALLLLNAIFVAVEFAIVRARPAVLKRAISQNRFGAVSAETVFEQSDLSLSTMQLGVTCASLLLGFIGLPAFYSIFHPWFSIEGLGFSATTSLALAGSISLLVLVILHLIFGELLARAIAIKYPEIVLQILAAPVIVLMQFCRPFVFLMNGSISLILETIGLTMPDKGGRVHTVDDLELIVTDSGERGVLDKDEEEMLHGVFGFSDTIAREVMTPRTDLITIRRDAEFDEVIQIVVSSGISRFPVIGDRVDDVLGILLAKDLLPLLAEPDSEARKSFHVEALMRKAYFIPGTKPIDDLLNEFKKRAIHMAIVLDEHGGVDGVVTLEDLLEEIVGDIYDESDVAEELIEVGKDGDVIVDGGILVADFNDRFQLEVPEGEYDTIAGFIFSTLGRMPRHGDTVTLHHSGHYLVNGTDPNASVYRNGSNSNGDSAHADASNGSNDEVEDEIIEPKAAIIVEKVVGHRIETLRLQQVLPISSLESESDPSAS